MELRQLRSIVTLVENGFSVSQTADQLHLVQSAVSQHISKLESEVGTDIFKRQGKRLVGLTDAGERILQYAYRALADTRSILEIGHDHSDPATGTLRVGTTHTQARYVLPPVIKAFRADYPDIEMQIHQGTPQQLVEMALSDRVDFSICTEALSDYADLTSIPCYRWNRSLIIKKDSPLMDRKRITLKLLCEEPIITYVFGFTGRGSFTDTFINAGLTPNVVLSAVDTDVIKTYVREGLGVGIIASLAYTPQQDIDLFERDLSKLFPWEVTKIAYMKGKYLRRFQQHFIELFQAHVSKSDHWRGLYPIKN